MVPLLLIVLLSVSGSASAACGDVSDIDLHPCGTVSTHQHPISFTLLFRSRTTTLTYCCQATAAPLPVLPCFTRPSPARSPVLARRLALVLWLPISLRQLSLAPPLTSHTPRPLTETLFYVRTPPFFPIPPRQQKCTQNNFLSTSDELCAFCYPVGKGKASCTSVTVANYNHPCGKPADASSPPHQYSYGIAGECDCATGIAQTGQCAACANAKHPGCVWVESGTQDITVDVPVLGKFTVTRWTNQTCKSTNTLIESKLYSVTNSFGTQLLGMKFKDTNTEWYWEQCTIPGIWFAVVAFGALLAALVVACACLCCCIRRMRGNGGGTQYSTNTYYVSN